MSAERRLQDGLLGGGVEGFKDMARKKQMPRDTRRGGEAGVNAETNPPG
jgi:hypothetical protein